MPLCLQVSDCAKGKRSEIKVGWVYCELEIIFVITIYGPQELQNTEPMVKEVKVTMRRKGHLRCGGRCGTKWRIPNRFAVVPNVETPGSWLSCILFLRGGEWVGDPTLFFASQYFFGYLFCDSVAICLSKFIPVWETEPSNFIKPCSIIFFDCHTVCTLFSGPPDIQPMVGPILLVSPFSSGAVIFRAFKNQIWNINIASCVPSPSIIFNEGEVWMNLKGFVILAQHFLPTKVFMQLYIANIFYLLHRTCDCTLSGWVGGWWPPPWGFFPLPGRTGKSLMRAQKGVM